VICNGDAAFAGQAGRRDAGTWPNLPATASRHHPIIVNNQTSVHHRPEFSRPSEYCTDVAKMIGAAIFHVNGDDPEACVWVAKLAVDFRRSSRRTSYRHAVYRPARHNEGDDRR